MDGFMEIVFAPVDGFSQAQLDNKWLIGTVP